MGERRRACDPYDCKHRNATEIHNPPLQTLRPVCYSAPVFWRGVMAEIRPTGFTNCNFPVGSSGATTSGYDLHFTLDGNLELTGPRKGKLWESGTRGRGGAILSMQRDGDLVIYDAARRRALWSSGTKGNPGA